MFERVCSGGCGKILPIEDSTFNGAKAVLVPSVLEKWTCPECTKQREEAEATAITEALASKSNTLDAETDSKVISKGNSKPSKKEKNPFNSADKGNAANLSRREDLGRAFTCIHTSGIVRATKVG